MIKPLNIEVAVFHTYSVQGRFVNFLFENTRFDTQIQYTAKNYALLPRLASRSAWIWLETYKFFSKLPKSLVTKYISLLCITLSPFIIF
jgi:hypothetical protein